MQQAEEEEEEEVLEGSSNQRQTEVQEISGRRAHLKEAERLEAVSPAVSAAGTGAPLCIVFVLYTTGSELPEVPAADAVSGKES